MKAGGHPGWAKIVIEPDIKGRTLIIIDVFGDGPSNYELDAIAGNWHMIGMPRGKYELHPAEVEQLLRDIHKAIMPYTKNGNNGG